MSCQILTDHGMEASVLYCTTTCRPLDHEAFQGENSDEQAADFVEWLGCDPRALKDLREKGFTSGPNEHGAWYPALDYAIVSWHAVAFDDHDEFVGTQG